jgi:hypothetical protein
LGSHLEQRPIGEHHERVDEEPLRLQQLPWIWLQLRVSEHRSEQSLRLRFAMPVCRYVRMREAEVTLIE